MESKINESENYPLVLYESQWNKQNTKPDLKIKNTELFHSVIDFKQKSMAVGFSYWNEGEDGPEQHTFHVIQSRQGISVEPTDEAIFIGNKKYFLNGSILPPLVEDRWSLAKINDFLKNPTCPTGIFHVITSTVKKYLELQDDSQYGLIATWLIGTYFAHLFPAFPFLLFIGPKETGKSKILEVINLMAFNATKVKTISEAALCDTTDGLRGTVLIDQAESMSKNLVGFLADSYKKAGAKRRIIGHKNGNRLVKEYSGYGPKAFATTNALDDDLNDRCCQIFTQRSLQPTPDILGYESVWAIIRDICYRFLFLQWSDIFRAYISIPPTGNRKGELWRPLEAILKVLKVSPEEYKKIKQEFEQGTQRTQTALSDVDEALFQVLLKQSLRHQTFEMTAPDILHHMKPILHKNEYPTPQQLGSKIAIYNLADEKKKKTRQKLIHYRFSASRVKDLAKRYVR